MREAARSPLRLGIRLLGVERVVRRVPRVQREEHRRPDHESVVRTCRGSASDRGCLGVSCDRHSAPGLVRAYHVEFQRLQPSALERADKRLRPVGALGDAGGPRRSDRDDGRSARANGLAHGGRMGPRQDRASRDPSVAELDLWLDRCRALRRRGSSDVVAVPRRTGGASPSDAVVPEVRRAIDAIQLVLAIALAGVFVVALTGHAGDQRQDSAIPWLVAFGASSYCWSSSRSYESDDTGLGARLL